MIQSESVAVTPHDIGLSQHVALVYERSGDQLSVMAGFLSEGLRNHQFCFYIHDESTPAAVSRALRLVGVDAERAIAGGRLALADKSTSFLAGGRFDTDEMLAMLQSTVDSATAGGLAGVRAAGEMCWALGPHPGIDQLMTYEALCNGFIESNPIAGLCMYNRSRFDAESLRHMVRTHPYVIVRGRLCRNYYYVPAGEYLAGDFDDGLGLDQILDSILRREVAERTLVSAELTIEGGRTDDPFLADARRLTAIYSELVRYKEELLERSRSRVRRPGDRGQAEADILIQEGELDAMRQRLAFWEGSRQRLLGVDFDLELGVLSFQGRSVRLSRRESQLLGALMVRQGRPIPARELVRRAWNTEELSEAQLRSYVVALRKKLALIEVPASLLNQPRLGYSVNFDPAPLQVLPEVETTAV